MASCGAPPSSLIIMNLLATSVFTHYNKVSSIKDLDVTPPKLNSTYIDYIDDAFSVKNKPIIDDKYDVDPAEKLGTNEIDIKTNKEHMVEYINDGFQSTKGASVGKPSKEASNWQGNDVYTGIDDWSDITLKLGEVYYRGEPGGGEFFTKRCSIDSVSADKSKLFQGLQVQEHPSLGYRGEMQGYILKTDLGAAEAKCLANSQFGEGGLDQIFIPSVEELIEKGILVLVDKIKLK
ncbi:MAG: hypothetical protein RR546_02560 [Erysipelotrichaceae bacterium]